MFDVTDKRAVDRLAAVVVMLKAREAEARQAYDKASEQYNRDVQRCAIGHYIEDPRSAELALHRASSRLTEAESALAAARELATDR